MKGVEFVLLMLTMFLGSCATDFMKSPVVRRVDKTNYTTFYITEQSEETEICLFPGNVLDLIKEQISLQMYDYGLKQSFTNNVGNIKINIGLTLPIEVAYKETFIFAYPFFNDKRYDYLTNYFYTPKYLEDIVIPDRVVIDFVDTKTNKLLTSVVSPKIQYGDDFLADHLIRT